MGPRAALVAASTSAFLVAAWAPVPTWRGTDESPEIARIQAHILRAERFAAARDLSRLWPSARAARYRLLHELELYRQRGVFPQNRDFPGRRVPYFVDAQGVRCAMAHLIEISGGAALVRHVASTRNNAYVRELVNEPGLVAWLDRNGLTLEEAARIQPQYGEVNPPASNLTPRERNVMVASALSASSAGILLNTWKGSTHTQAGLRGFPGVGLGLGATILGASVFADAGHDARPWGTFCISMGAISMGMGIHQLAQAPPPVTPTVWLGPDGATGLALRMAF